jgi:hypothetical protein
MLSRPVMDVQARPVGDVGELVQGDVEPVTDRIGVRGN